MKRIRPWKSIYRSINREISCNDDSLPAADIIFQVTERTIDKHGNKLLFPEIEVETYWTDFYENSEIPIDLYHDHDTSEQFHSELKTDMDVERFPSGKFAVNSLIG
ncbi:hypothetical protein GK047_23785 [Paenibacillus sp. SYP-B3998]|uniref:Uncharacterized protein n=1 Tax=Paenibacillus sp. SYP-B3998 TaxID=2678564 RepID=A0A6G4A5U6_9BACL|nr:hypothetical protein [Paenibacillus sp. SYP-B3998]NEW09017.1 hypothetical protein [Paenibacillus sp. SYP-B3998]